jgi:hypothetical protein
MAGFKRRPLAEELTAALRQNVRDVPVAIPEPRREGEGRARAPKTVQVNFNVSEDFARLLAALAREAGSTRRLIARWAQAQGHEVPEADLNPIDNRRRW